MRFFLIAITCLCLGITSLTQAMQLVRDDQERGIQVFVETPAKNSYQSFYATTTIPASMNTVYAVLSDVRAMPEWIARMTVAREIKRQEPNQLWVQGVYKLPYPFKDREAVLYSQVQRNPQAITIQTQAVTGFLTNDKSRVRLTEMNSRWQLTMISAQETKVELWGQGNPGGLMPAVLFNYNLADEPWQTLKNLRQMVKRKKYQS